MKKMTLGLLLCWLAVQGVAAETIEWLTDLPAAQAKAKAEKKLVFMDFTGSDWCVVCKKLDKEVYSTKLFSKYAATNFVMVEIDFPLKKPQPAALEAANKALEKQYAIEGYPTIIILDGDGKKLGQMNYVEGGAKAFIAELEKITKKP